MNAAVFVLGLGLLVLLGRLIQSDKPLPYGWCNECDGDLLETGWCQTCRKRRPL
jgi:hypothetical protein